MASSARIEELEKKFNENPRRYFAPLANEYRKAGETEQAIALCRAYLPQQPGHMSGHIVFGQALFDAGEIDEAQGVFETALSLDPENLIALRHLGDIAHSRGDLAGARSWYRRVLDADPRNEEIAAQLAALPDDGAGATPVGTPDGKSGSAGWGEINPERSGAAAAMAEPKAEAGADARTGAASAASPEIERASASTDDDVDIDALFKTTDARPATANAPMPAPVRAGEEKTAEVPVFEDAADAAGAAADEDATAEAKREQRETITSSGAEPADHEAPEAPSDDAPRPSRERKPSDGLGLEVAEFVPPAPSEPAERTLGFETGHEAVVGGPVGSTPGGSPATSGRPAEFVTETMAELYLQQGFVQEALSVYRQLVEQNPDDAALRERVAQLEQGARSSVSVAAVSDEVVEAARRRQASPSRRSMRQFLGTLAARRPPQRHVVGGNAEAGIEPEAHGAASSGTSSEPAPAGDVLALEGGGPVAHSEEQLPFAPQRNAQPANDGLDALFAGAEIDPDDQAAATALAGAFDSTTIPVTTAGPRGRPTRAAPSELSLDNVFRESGGDAGLQRPRSDFSFDQFFSDEASASSPHANGGEEPAEPSAEPPSQDDIGQFNAWLEGLKKK